MTALWFSKPVSTGSGCPAGESRSIGARAGHNFADGAPPTPLHGRHVEELEAGVGGSGAVGKGPAQELVSGAHTQHHGAVFDGPTDHSVGPKGLGRPHLGTVLSPADAVDVGGRQGPPRRGLDEVDLDPPPRRPPGQDDAVAPVAVRSEQVGIDDGDGQRRRTPRARGADDSTVLLSVSWSCRRHGRVGVIAVPAGRRKRCSWR